jgi:hypothetical protein
MFVSRDARLSGLVSQNGYIKRLPVLPTPYMLSFRWIVKGINSSELCCRDRSPKAPDDEEQDDCAESGKGTVL